MLLIFCVQCAQIFSINTYIHTYIYVYVYIYFVWEQMYIFHKVYQQVFLQNSSPATHDYLINEATLMNKPQQTLLTV
jgi:hypothetical protein